MSLDRKQFVRYVIAPTLEYIDCDGPVERALMLGTALTESGLIYLNQVRGPAAGIMQMEQEDHDDIWKNYLPGHPSLQNLLRGLMIKDLDLIIQLRVNMAYAVAMCRIHYLRAPESLPGMNAADLAQYHKNHYNTAVGATDISKSVVFFQDAVDLIGAWSAS